MGYRRKIFDAKKRSRSRKKYIKREEYAAANRQCLHKVAYSSERKIIEKINLIAEQGRRGLRYYQCPFCDLFHISSHKIRDQEFIS